MRRMPTELVVDVPEGMKGAFKSVYPISYITVSMADNPGPIIEACTPKFLKFISCNTFTHALHFCSTIV